MSILYIRVYCIHIHPLCMIATCPPCIVNNGSHAAYSMTRMWTHLPLSRNVPHFPQIFPPFTPHIFPHITPHIFPRPNTGNNSLTGNTSAQRNWKKRQWQLFVIFMKEYQLKCTVISNSVRMWIVHIDRYHSIIHKSLAIFCSPVSNSRCVYCT